ncbi:MAG: dihydrodipicolinate synthase family protein [Acidobacteria bacterium]|nr:dihydrodipicolinate synthase family protein [Acidobacteriota bacterium]
MGSSGLNLNGIFAALPTPFSQEGEVDYERLRHNLAAWNQTDLHGYLALGSTGEFPHLTISEKLSVMETMRDATPPEKMLLVGTGELSTRQTLEMCRRAHDYGADAAVVLTPFYYKKILHDEQQEAHFLRIADSSPLPILIYLMPQFAGVYLMPETVARLAEHQNIIGIKESSGDLPQLKDLFRELKAPAFDVLLGSANILAEGFEVGASGAILAVASLAPNACVAAEHAWRHGNFERAEALQRQLATLARETAGGGVGRLKAALDRTGLYGFLPRSPLPIPTQEDIAAVEKAIAESGLFTQSEDGSLWVETENRYTIQHANEDTRHND